MTYATATDVSNRLGRSLTPGETTQVTEYLKDAEAIILRWLPTILTDLVTDAALAQNLKSVECAITLRAARITDAVQAAYPETENWSTPQGSSRANVTILSSEWRKLGLKNYRMISFEPAEQLVPLDPGWGYYA